MKIVRFLMRLNSIEGDRIVFQAETRRVLLQRFKKDVEETSRITGLDLSHWLEI